MADKQAFFKFCAFLHVVLKGTYPRQEYITSCFIGKFIAHIYRIVIGYYTHFLRIHENRHQCKFTSDKYIMRYVFNILSYFVSIHYVSRQNKQRSHILFIIKYKRQMPAKSFEDDTKSHINCLSAFDFSFYLRLQGYII